VIGLVAMPPVRAELAGSPDEPTDGESREYPATV
jgi:hypothetical protein